MASQGNQLELKAFHQPLWDVGLLREGSDGARTGQSLCYPVTSGSFHGWLIWGWVLSDSG